MTLEEAKKVALICEDADGNCSSCVNGLAYLLQKAFPEFNWVYEEKCIKEREEDNTNRIFVVAKEQSS